MRWINKNGSKADKIAAREFLKSKGGKKSQNHNKSHQKSNPKKYKRTEPSEQLSKWINETRNNLLSKQTDAEIEFYSVLETLDIPFERQCPFIINSRVFFADAVFHDTHTVIEIDGGYHKKPTVVINDRVRTKHLNGIGYRVIRIKNEEVYNRPSFMSKISNRLPADVPAYLYI